MSCSSGWSQPAGPCANCDRPNGAVMGCSTWGHGGYCCSRACGERLSAKIRNGMVEPWRHSTFDYGFGGDDGDSGRMALRIRIKQLAAQVKALRRAATPPTQGAEQEGGE